MQRRSRIGIGSIVWIGLTVIAGMAAAAPQTSPSSTQQKEEPKFKTAPEVQALIDESKKAGNEFKWDEALRVAEKARAKAQELKDKYSEAAVLNRIGNVHYLSGDLRKALTAFQQAQGLYRGVGDRLGEAGMFNNIGAVYNILGDQTNALASYQQGLPITRQISDKRGESNILICIGNAYNDLNQPEKAEAFFREAMPIVQEMKNKPSEAIILNGLGGCASTRGERDKAMQYYQQSLALSLQMKSKRDEAMALANIGRIYDSLEQYQVAMNYFQQSLRLREQIGDKKSAANTQISMGILYAHLRQLAPARACFNRALTIYREIGDRAGEANAFNNTAAHYIESDEAKKALECQKQALAINRQIGNKNGEILTLANMGLVYQQLKQYPRALALFHDVRESNRVAKNPKFAATAANGTGNVYLDMKRYPDAQKSYREAIALYRQIGFREYEANTLGNLGWAQEKAGDQRGAAQSYRQAVHLLEALRSDVGTLSQSKVTFLAGHLLPYYRLIDNLLRQNRTAEAFALVQQTKSRTLLELMSGGRVSIREAMTPEEQEKESRLRSECDRLSTAMIAEGVKNEVGSKKRFAAFQGELRTTETELATFTDGLYARHPDLAQKRVARPFALTDAAKLLPKDTALLEYVILQPETGKKAQDRPVLFVVTSDGKITSHTLPTTKERVATQAEALRSACANPKKSYQTLSQNLYRDLIAPAEQRLRGKKSLIICPDSSLWDVPFATLLGNGGKREKGKGKSGSSTPYTLHPIPFLAERFTLSFGSSATGVQAAVSARKRNRASGSILALANPDFGDTKRFGDDPHLPGQRPIDNPSRPIDNPSRPIENPSRPLANPSRPIANPSRPIANPSRPIANPSRPLDLPSRDLSTQLRGGLAELKGTQKEADVLHRLYPDAAIYTRTEAQESVVKAKAGEYRILHLASHAFFNDISPMLSSIFLALPPVGDTDDGFLTAREIFDLKLNAEMAVLSACQTGRGEKRTGEGIIGLTWALFVAGCPTQVLSQWSVDDAATAQLMSRFYTELKRGKSKSDALRTAGTALLHTPKTRHPYYWAPFILIGDWR